MTAWMGFETRQFRWTISGVRMASGGRKNFGQQGEKACLKSRKLRCTLSAVPDLVERVNRFHPHEV